MRVGRPAAAVLLAAAQSSADVPADLVPQLPDFAPTPFKVYSGYLTVPGPFEQTAYDKLVIHYQFHTSQGDPTADPVATWHNGGPGASSIDGLYSEMGYFQVNSTDRYVNPYAWNKVANMLYLESPAGSAAGDGSYSYCVKNGKNKRICEWNDTSQAEAYTHTLLAFFDAFPEFKGNDLYLTGESYAGQYIPNIANFILTKMPERFPNLRGLALGNACWGGTETKVQCNGPSEDHMDAKLFYGKGLMSKQLYDQIESTCDFPKESAACEKLLKQMDSEVGPHNVYNIYDNCPSVGDWVQASGKSMRWLRSYLRSGQPREGLTGMGGGYDWSCGGMAGELKYFLRKEVRDALHLGNMAASAPLYTQTGPASVTLWPSLIASGKLRVLIYNGDADSCVPYIGNEEWTTSMVDKGVATEREAWHPWYSTTPKTIPAGYATTYNVVNATTDFSFITIRLAGHMVPTFQPAVSLSFFERFLAGKSF